MTDYDYSLTRDEIIEASLSIAGVLAEGESMTSTQLSKGVLALNVIVKAWQNVATFPWTLTNFSLPLVQGDRDYDLSSYEIVDIFKAELKYDNREIPIELETYSEYHETYDKTDTGRPACIAYHRTASAPTLYVYPAPDQSSYYTLEILGIKNNKDLQSGVGVPEFASRWYKAIIYQLASDLGDHYQLSMSEREVLERKAAREFKAAKTGNSSNVTRRGVRSAY